MVNRFLEDYRVVKDKVISEKAVLANLNQEVNDIEAAQQLVQGAAQQVQQRANKQIAGVVSKCLTTVFEDAYEFRIVFDKKRGKTEGRLVFLRDGNEFDPLSASGGGVVDIAALALRLSSILISQPPKRRLVVLDEPFRHLATELKPLAGRLVLELAKETNTQFVIVTHDPAIEVGKIVDLTP